jgi:hypothetical protein
MPLGNVSNEDFEAELKNSSTVLKIPLPVHKSPVLEVEDPIIINSADIIRRNEHGRNEGDVNVPHSVRKLLGDTATFEGRQSALALASNLGISSSSVSGYTNPKNSAMAEVNKQDITAMLLGRKTKISKRALNKLNLAISLISEDKLTELKATELSSVAKDMAQVAKHMEPPKSEDTKSEPVQFHFYAPQVRNENHYETVVAKDNY